MNWLRSHSIKAHVIVFIMMLVMLFGLVNVIATNKISAVRHAIDIRHQLAAKAEVAKALLTMQQNMLIATNKFIDSDETHQQLYDAGYYGYWRDIRALQSGMLPATVTAIELYDRHGNALARPAGSDMPNRVQGLPALWMGNHGGRIYAYLLRSIYDGYSKTQRSGYVLIRFDFIAALRETMPFLDVSMQGLSADIAPNEHLTMGETVSRLRYQVNASPDVDALFAVMQTTQYQVLAVLLSLSFLLYIVVMRFVARPLANLSTHIHLLRDHPKSHDAPEFNQHLYVIELENVRRSLNNYQHQLDGMHRRIEDKNQALWTMAHKDGLTGAYNRLGYDEDIASLVNAVVLQPVAVSLMLIDCDKFKAINDSHGHQVGDEVLITLVKLIQSCLRAADKLYRIGGDEFVVVLTNTDAEYSEALGQRFLAAVAECDLHWLALSEPLTISIGIAHALVGDAQTLTYLHKCADQSMYQAKQQTAPKLVVCDVAMT